MRTATTIAAAARTPRSARTMLVLSTVLVLAAIWAGPGLIRSAVDLWRADALDRDDTAARSGAREPRLVIVGDGAGGLLHARVDADLVAAFARAETAALAEARAGAVARARAVLDAETAAVFDAMHARSADFVDWYLAWPTAWRLLGHQAVSAGTHLLRPSLLTLGEAVERDTEALLERRYAETVLDPAGAQSRLEAALRAALSSLETDYLRAVDALDRRLRALARAGITIESGTWDATEARLALDWEARTRRLPGSRFDRGALEVLRGTGLGLAAAGIGRAAGAAAGAALARGGGRAHRQRRGQRGGRVPPAARSARRSGWRPASRPTTRSIGSPLTSSAPS
ncbi:MAG: hypothetical protein H6982_05125 [Chromatiales bacterium]|nr:hypothetical protein [Chromatiales bacterium]